MADAPETDAADSGLAGFFNCQIDGFACGVDAHPLVAVDNQCIRVLPDDLGFGGRNDGAVRNAIQVGRDPKYAVRVVAGEIRTHQYFGDCLCDVAGDAGSRKQISGGGVDVGRAKAGCGRHVLCS